MKDFKLFEIGPIRMSFAWYDIWMGLFIDTNKGKIYVCPLPFILLTYTYKIKPSFSFNDLCFATDSGNYKQYILSNVRRVLRVRQIPELLEFSESLYKTSDVNEMQRLAAKIQTVLNREHIDLSSSEFNDPFVDYSDEYLGDVEDADPVLEK